MKTTNKTPADCIIQGDCLEVLAKFPDESIDFALFSPPYDGIRDYKKNWQFDFVGLGGQLHRVIKDGGVCVVVIGDSAKNFAKSMTSFRLAVSWVDVIGWKMFETCIYRRAGNPGAWWKQRFRVDHEYILIFFKGQRPAKFHKEHLMIPSKHAGKIYTGTDRLTSGGFKKIEPKAVNPMKDRGTVWEYATSNTEGNRLKLEHPATFPDNLARDIILTFTEPGDIVLDPMCGSGTTCVMAARNKRHFIGIDIAERRN
jgi:DNA modification methylase